ncbi:hypothetical protein BIFCAT_01810 [Bifidobacterium catenulatum DSM 16992 = JCM 1194 = LMG 11043]|uniref:Uncharacterized protein n=1 Tax=Bifidobacterium catenulatum DSM 16992 = JCM 1194 = LMG 11043 TaxID=566552 RepID=B6XXD6_9BIFI|nr:hypothetical protein BIFCAT_01810 [Bifidobacterium catenulatum DSM 16992 = JCM 1194 = LMG 11043]
MTLLPCNNPQQSLHPRFTVPTITSYQNIRTIVRLLVLFHT